MTLSSVLTIRSSLRPSMHSLWSMRARNGQRMSSSATFQLKPFKLHKLEESPKTEVTLDREDALNFYREMMTIRRMETANNALYKDKTIRGFCHLYSGQEAVAVGMHHSMRKSDAVITAYRAHGWAYIRGVSVQGVMSELTGRRTGCARGKGGSMHMYCPNFYGGNGIVGAQVPLGAGIALALKYKGTDDLCVTVYGDGASNQGQVFEAFNMSKLWSLPVIYVCENNGFGMGTSSKRSSASTDYYTRGDYIPGIWVDGMDVLAVREATRYLAEMVRAGKGPFIMEAFCYRYHGHSMSDPGTSYRTREEIQEVRKTRDPITTFRDKIIGANLVTDEEIKNIDAEIKKEVDEAVAVAKNEPEIEAEELYGDVYANPLEQQIRGVTPFTEQNHISVNKPHNIRT